MDAPADPGHATPNIRQQRDEDDPAVAQLLTRSFDRPMVADLARALRAGPAGSPGLALVAETVGRLVGQVQLSRSWLDAEQRLVQVLVLSPLGVLPEWQHRGIGSRLVTEVLSQARELGPPLVFLEGSPTYYHRFGFRPAGPLGFTAPSTRIPPAAFQVVLLPGYEPWMTGTLVYSESFWAYDCVGLRNR